MWSKNWLNEWIWVFFGMPGMCYGPYIREFHPGVFIEHYPANWPASILIWRDCTAGRTSIQPGKSSLRLLEYGVLGYPVICTDILRVPRRISGYACQNQTAAWVKAIRDHIHDLDATARRAMRCASVMLQPFTGKQFEPWMQAWFDN